MSPESPAEEVCSEQERTECDQDEGERRPQRRESGRVCADQLNENEDFIQKLQEKVQTKRDKIKNLLNELGEQRNDNLNLRTATRNLEAELR